MYIQNLLNQNYKKFFILFFKKFILINKNIFYQVLQDVEHVTESADELEALQ